MAEPSRAKPSWVELDITNQYVLHSHYTQMLMNDRTVQSNGTHKSTNLRQIETENEKTQQQQNTEVKNATSKSHSMKIHTHTHTQQHGNESMVVREHARSISMYAKSLERSCCLFLHRCCVGTCKCPVSTAAISIYFIHTHTCKARATIYSINVGK